MGNGQFLVNVVGVGATDLCPQGQRAVLVVIVPHRAREPTAPSEPRWRELRREREGTKCSEKEAQRDAAMPRGSVIRWSPSESSAGPARVRQSGAVPR